MVLLGAPTQPTYQSIPSPLSPPDSGKSNVQIYPAGTTVRTWSRRPQLPNHTPAQRHGSTRSATLGKGPDRQPTRSERMLKPAAHLRSTSTRHLGPGRTQHPALRTEHPSPSSGPGHGRKQQQQQQQQQRRPRTRSLSSRPPSFRLIMLCACLHVQPSAVSRSVGQSASLSAQLNCQRKAGRAEQSKVEQTRLGGQVESSVFRWQALAPTLHRAATTNGMRTGTRQGRTNRQGSQEQGWQVPPPQRARPLSLLCSPPLPPSPASCCP